LINQFEAEDDTVHKEKIEIKDYEKDINLRGIDTDARY